MRFLILSRKQTKKESGECLAGEYSARIGGAQIVRGGKGSLIGCGKAAKIFQTFHRKV